MGENLNELEMTDIWLDGTVVPFKAIARLELRFTLFSADDETFANAQV